MLHIYNYVQFAEGFQWDPNAIVYCIHEFGSMGRSGV